MMSATKYRPLWLYYFIVAILIGIVVETISGIMHFYQFHPGWLVIAIIVLVFGGVFGTLAWVLCGKKKIVQFIAGVLAAGCVETINALGLSRNYYWVFAEGWPLGIGDPWLRTVVLSIPGGLCMLLLNYVVPKVKRGRV